MLTKIYCLSETLSPLTQMARSEGNEGIINREPVSTVDGVRWVACLSGNAIRHRMVRRPGALYLIKTCGLAGVLTKAQMNFLLHGGDRTDKGGMERLARGYEMRRLMPLLALLAGALPDEIMSGSLVCWRGVLVCEENRATLEQILPEGFELPAEKLPPAESFTTTYQYTRGDVSRTAPELLSVDGTFPLSQSAGSNQMIVGGQAVMRGAQFFHGFELKAEDPLQMGALLHSLSLWERYASSIGGQSSRGHGKLKMRVSLPRAAQVELITAYVEHTKQNKDAICEWFAEAFKPAPKKEGKKKATVSGVVADA